MSDSQESFTVRLMLAAEKQVLRDQAKSEGNKGKPKPANIIDKIISGRISKVSGPHVVMNCSCTLSSAAHHQQLHVLFGRTIIVIANLLVYMFASQIITTVHTILSNWDQKLRYMQARVKSSVGSRVKWDAKVKCTTEDIIACVHMYVAIQLLDDAVL